MDTTVQQWEKVLLVSLDEDIWRIYKNGRGLRGISWESDGKTATISLDSKGTIKSRIQQSIQVEWGQLADGYANWSCFQSQYCGSTTTSELYAAVTSAANWATHGCQFCCWRKLSMSFKASKDETLVQNRYWQVFWLHTQFWLCLPAHWDRDIVTSIPRVCLWTPDTGWAIEKAKVAVKYGEVLIREVCCQWAKWRKHP